MVLICAALKANFAPGGGAVSYKKLSGVNIARYFLIYTGWPSNTVSDFIGTIGPGQSRTRTITDIGKERKMNTTDTVNHLLSESIEKVLWDFEKILLKRPRLVLRGMRALMQQKKAAVLRKRWEKQGVNVPAIMILSVTNACNLHCKGCYSRAIHCTHDAEMSDAMLYKIFSEARALGTSIVLLAGGEPLMRQGLFELTGQFRDMLFPVFTNGTLIDERTADLIAKQKNIVPVLSIEGFEEQTDRRRGEGTYKNVLRAMDLLGRRNIIWGTSITVTTDNIGFVTNPEFVGQIIERGCNLFFYTEFVPVEEKNVHLALDADRRKRFMQTVESLKTDFPAIFIAFPGDEEMFDGCLAAGRGFVHISANGDVQPCPFAPYSDTNLHQTSLRGALRSRFLTEVRSLHSELKESTGGCVLWQNRELVESLLRAKAA